MAKDLYLQGCLALVFITCLTFLAHISSNLSVSSLCLSFYYPLTFSEKKASCHVSCTHAQYIWCDTGDELFGTFVCRQWYSNIPNNDWNGIQACPWTSRLSWTGKFHQIFCSSSEHCLALNTRPQLILLKANSIDSAESQFNKSFKTQNKEAFTVLTLTGFYAETCI